MNGKSLFWVLCCLNFFLAGCDEKQLEKERITFNQAFPKPNKDLSAILGRRFQLKSGSDTLELAISSAEERNLITEVRTGDTVFHGKISRYRGLYYFSQAVNDTSFQIYAVKISDNLVYGLGTEFLQNAAIEKEIRKGRCSKMVRYIAPDSSIFQLEPKKQEARKLFSQIIRTLVPDTILPGPKNISETQRTAWSEVLSDPEESALISRIYPNPTSGSVHLTLQDRNVTYQLSDLQGKTLETEKLNAPAGSIDLTKRKNGIYVLTLTSADGSQKESTRLVKN